MSRLCLSRLWKLFRDAVAVVCALAIAIVLLPSKARGQLGLDPCCAIMQVGLNTISGLLRNVVAAPLRSIQQKPTAVGQLRAAGGVSSGRDYPGQKHGMFNSKEHLCKCVNSFRRR